MMKWIIIAGLGNPGDKYINTKHNVGFKVLNRIAKIKKEQWGSFKKSGQLIFFKKQPHNILLFKPTTFMNNSGKALIDVMDYFQIDTSSLFLVHDEKGLPLGIIKYSYALGANGHNGVANVIHMMQSKEFMRARFGIGNPYLNQKLEDYVLSPFPKQAKQKIASAINLIAQDILDFIEHQDFVKLQNKRNRAIKTN